MPPTFPAASEPLAESFEPSALPRVLLGLGLAVALAAYIGCLRFQFVYDDHGIAGLQFTQWREVSGLFLHPLHVANAVAANYYRPTLVLANFLTYKLFGFYAPAWHGVAIAIHLCATFLVYRVAAQLTGDRVTGAMAAAFFGAHAVHVEAVAWISGALSEALMTFWLLTATLVFLRWRKTRNPWWLALSLVPFALALLNKETAIVFPALAFLYAWCDGENRFLAKLRSSILAALPYAVLGVVYLVIRTMVLKGVAPQRSGSSSLAAALMTWPAAAWFYLGQLVWPHPLSLYYDVRLVRHPGLLNFVLPLLALLGLTAALWWWARRCKAVVLGCAWLVFPLLPALAGMIGFERGELVHDRYLYVPSIGFVILLAMGVRQLTGVRSKLFGLPALQAVATLAITCGLAVATASYSSAWASDLLLYDHSARVSPGNVIATAQLATQLSKRGQRAAALELYRRAVASDPEDWRGQIALGVTLLQFGDLAGAEQHLLITTRLNPGEAAPLFMLGMAQAGENKLAEAEQSYRAAIALAPSSPRQHFELARILEQQGRFADARDAYRAELAVAPDSEETRTRLDGVERRLRETTPPR